jgi:hypothetical protein
VAAWVAERAVGGGVRTALPETVEDLSERFAVPVEKRGRLLMIEDAWAAVAAAAAAAAADPAGEEPLRAGT